MPHRIWFKQQQPFDYLPLKVGVGLLPESILNYENCFMANLGVKKYTTRKRRMEGDYYVVQGSRFNAKPVEPRIEFAAFCRGILNLRDGTLDGSRLMFPDRFAEVDLGIKGVTFNDLCNELLSLNKGATLDTPFFVNRLTPFDMEVSFSTPEITLVKSI